MQQQMSKKMYQIAALFLAIAVGFSNLNVNAAAVTPLTGTVQSVNLLADENLSAGVHYTEENITNFRDQDGHKLRVNHLTINPSNPDTKIISAKSMDTVGGRETVLNQAARETLKGNNVIAGINADSYDIDNSSGISRGIHIQDGYVIESQPTDTYTTAQPCFYVRKDGKVGVGPVNAAGNIAVGNAAASLVPLLNRNDFTWASDTNNTRIFTSNITQNHVLTHITGYGNPLPSQMGFALIKIDNEGFDYRIEAGKTYTGTVEKTYTADGFTIPQGYIVYAGYGDKAAGVSSIAAGTKITYTCNVYTKDGYSSASLEGLGQADNNIQCAITSFHLLAKGGVKTDVAIGQGTDNNARTVIGVTADGTIHALACNKPSATMTDTDGVSFSDITDYMMQDLHCVDVLNLDGGGSTTMVARRVGSGSLSTVNYPSDGTDRIVGNSLLFVSTAEKSSAVSQVALGASVQVFKNSHYDFSYKLTDANGSGISTEGKTVQWRAQRGSVDANGRYQAPDGAGEDTVTATVDGITGSVKVTVEDQVSSFALSVSGTIALQAGEKKKIDFLAYSANGSRIYIDPAAAAWQLKDQGIVSVADGTVTPAAASGETDLTVSFMSYTIPIHIIVGMKEQIIDNFEESKIDGYKTGSYMFGAVGSQYGGGANKGNSDKYIGFATNGLAKDGNNSLRITYNTANWTNRGANGVINLVPFWDDLANYSGTSTWNEADRAAMESRYTAKAMPKKFGLWVYSGDENHDGVSDNYDCMMTAVFQQQCTGYNMPGCYDHTINLKLTPTEHMDWIGWKWIEVSFPQDLQMPIVFNYLWVANINKQAKSYQTSLMFDDLKYIYTDDQQDLEGPAFSDTTPKAGTLVKDSLDLSTTVTDAMSGVDAASISVKVNDADYTGPKSFDAATGKLSFTLTGLQDQQSYNVSVTAKDKVGNASTSYVSNTYKVDLQPDKEAPVVTQVTPSHDVKVQIPRPRVGFNLTDVKSGVNKDSIRVTLNGTAVKDVYYDENTGWGYAQPDWDLTKGSCALAITALDKQGNTLAYTDTIEVDPIAQPKDPANYKIDVIPDTQGNAYAERLFQKMAADGSDFSIHLGDITDAASDNEYQTAKQYEQELNKPLFVVPGNHEASMGNLDSFYKNFGSPTYTFVYGNSRFIMLNSAYNQSVSVSDSTQYHYLQDILDQNTSPNVYVINHVVTRDDFYTEHNMTSSEASQFEGIMSAYKAKNPSSNVNVIFGHLHTSYSWQVGGVNYIIGGNAAGKGYVSNDQGDMLGYGSIVTKDGAAKYVYEPFLTTVYIKNDALIGNTVKTFRSANIQLDLYGDFREYPSSYITKLNAHKEVDISWSSSDSSVASVDEKGVVTANKVGTANITAVSGGKSNTVTVDVHDPSEANISKMQLTLPDGVKVNDTVLPVVKGTDAYGTVFVLNNSDITFEFANKLLSRSENGTITATGKGDETVTAKYKGLESTVSLSILPADSELKTLQLQLPAAVKVGDTAIPVITATNYYGVTRAIDPSTVQFTFDNGRMSASADGAIHALALGQETVHAAYQGLNAEATVQVSSDSGNNTNTGEPAKDVNQATQSLCLNPTVEKIELNASSADVISSETLNAIRTSGKTVTYSVYGENDQLLYSYTIDGKQISDTSLPVKLGLSFTCADEKKIDKLTGDSKSVYLTFSHSGTLPGPVKVKVYVGNEFKDGDSINLYYYNESTGKPELISTQITVSGGYAEFTITHCSEYFLTAKTLDLGPNTGSSSPEPFVWVAAISLAAVAGLYVIGRKKHFLKHIGK